MITPLIQAALTANHYDLPKTTIDRFAIYLQLLQKWNRVFNLTSITDINDMVLLHLIDSLTITTYLHGHRCIDIGTGAGLPGIPLAIMHPEKNFVLLDSNGKKTRFLTEVRATLALTNVDIVQSRCEDYHPAACFDSIVSRAFASLNAMVQTTAHLLCPEGQFLAMKGVYPAAEIAELPAVYTLVAAHKLTIVPLLVERHVLCIKRT